MRVVAQDGGDRAPSAVPLVSARRRQCETSDATDRQCVRRNRSSQDRKQPTNSTPRSPGRCRRNVVAQTVRRATTLIRAQDECAGSNQTDSITLEVRSNSPGPGDQNKAGEHRGPTEHKVHVFRCGRSRQPLSHSPQSRDRDGGEPHVACDRQKAIPADLRRIERDARDVLENGCAEKSRR